MGRPTPTIEHPDPAARSRHWTDYDAAIVLGQGGTIVSARIAADLPPRIALVYAQLLADAAAGLIAQAQTRLRTEFPDGVR